MARRLASPTLGRFGGSFWQCPTNSRQTRSAPGPRSAGRRQHQPHQVRRPGLAVSSRLKSSASPLKATPTGSDSITGRRNSGILPASHTETPRRSGITIPSIPRIHARTTLGRFGGFLTRSREFEGRQARSAPNRGCFHLQRRESPAPASDSTSRTKSACRDRRCLVNMCFTCERIVLSSQPVAAAISRTFMP